MKIKFIGVGGAFAPISKGNSNILIEADNGKKLMVDFGTTAPYILRDEFKIDFQDIDAVYVSHSHADHCGGLELFAFSRYFIPKKDEMGEKVRPKLYMGSTEAMQELWEHTLRGGLESVEGKVNNLTDYFECLPVDKNHHFTWNDIQFQPIQTLHIMSGYTFKNSYGLLIQPFKWEQQNDSEYLKIFGKSIFITTDIQFCPYQLNTFYDQSDVIFHDCETLKGMKSRVHAHYDDLKTLPLVTRNKMWMYHYGDKIETVKEDGFCGFVDKGQEFEF